MTDDRRQVTTEHPLGRLLEKSENWPDVVLVAVLATLIAPVVEELLLRLTLQAWLEAVERRWRRRARWLRRGLPGAMPVVFVSLCFAALHVRRAAGPEELPSGAVLVAEAIGHLATIGVLLLWLRRGAGATLGDLGIEPRLWRRDVAVGLVAWAAFAGPIYLFFGAIRPLAPGLVLDPLPIFFLALVLGTLYYRTHRILPSIVLHAAFNAIGVLLGLASRPPS